MENTEEVEVAPKIKEIIEKRVSEEPVHPTGECTDPTHSHSSSSVQPEKQNLSENTEKPKNNVEPVKEASPSPGASKGAQGEAAVSGASAGKSKSKSSKKNSEEEDKPEGSKGKSHRMLIVVFARHSTSTL